MPPSRANPSRGVRARRWPSYRPACVALAGIAVIFGATAPCNGVIPGDARVKALIEAGLDRLSSMPVDERLGGQCLGALALHKAGRPNDPRVAQAVSACVAAASRADELDIYSHGLALIFMAEVAGQGRQSTTKQLLDSLVKRQKPHGGWGYDRPNDARRTGDTSQTQYVALGLWQAHQVGLRINAPAARGLIDWLCRTQSPEGAWGYQGQVAEGYELRKQSGVSRTMGSAALASLMIGADLHGLLAPGALSVAGDLSAEGNDLPASVKRVRQRVAGVPALPPEGSDWVRVADALRTGEAWMSENATKRSKRYPYYDLYALERFHSFREARLGKFEDEPVWYTRGFEYLQESQAQSGLWNAGCGPQPDTAFAVLFLLRATQKSLLRRIGEGALVSGRGLPTNLAAATLRRGQVVVEMDAVGVGDFLAMMTKGDSDRLDALAADPSALVVGELTATDAEQLARVLRSGAPDMRRLAARALGRGGELDHVPALLYALTDPDPLVARAARDGLRFIARRPRGFGMPDVFTDDERYLALEQWKEWYQKLRPEEIIDVGR